MQREEQFELHAAAWERHRRDHAHHANPTVYLRCEAFEGLVAMGVEILPLIFARYRPDQLFWGALLSRITGHAEFGDGVLGDRVKARQAWLRWWEEQEGP